MNNHETARRVRDGDARIGRAFRLSVVVMLLIAVVGAGLYVWQLPDETGTGTGEATVVLPESRETHGSDGAGAPPAVHFTDITTEAGIGFEHVNAAYGRRFMPETMGSGAAFLDYDNDGDQDLFLVNARHWEDHPDDYDDSTPPLQALYRNDGHGRFEAITREAGLALETFGMGVAVGDYDGDGWDDLFITSLHENHLLRNNGGHFEAVTEEAGVGGRGDLWSTSAAFFDYDNDGDLDLFVANYVKWSRSIDLEIDFRLAGVGRAYGAPDHFTGTHSYLYRNEGDGTFTDVSEPAGIRIHDPESGLPVGKGLGVVPLDYDDDGRIDLMVANDTVRNFLFHNLGGGRFEEVGAFEGMAYDRQGKSTSGMGIDAARYRNDAETGIAIGNFANEMSSLYVTTAGSAPFADDAVIEGLGPASRLALTFGVLFLDYDLDGRLDLLQANGHLEPEINRVQESQHYAQPAQLFWNCGGACDAVFVEAPDPGDLTRPLVGRGATCADIDADGDLDVLITQNGRRPALLRNDQQLGHHWLRLVLAGRAPNHRAIGARVALTAGGVTQYRTLMPARSYLSQVEMPLTFGLGAAGEIESLRITWPEGTEQQLHPAAVDTTLRVSHPDRAE